MNRSDWFEGLLWAEDMCTSGEGWGSVPVKIMLEYAHEESACYESPEDFFDGAHSYAEHVWKVLNKLDKQ